MQIHQKIFRSLDNTDLEPRIPSMVEAIQKPDTVPDCVYALAEPLHKLGRIRPFYHCANLERGFKERKTAIKRKCTLSRKHGQTGKESSRCSSIMPIVMLLEHGLKTISDPNAEDDSKRPMCLCARKHQRHCFKFHPNLLLVSLLLKKKSVRTPLLPK